MAVEQEYPPFPSVIAELARYGVTLEEYADSIWTDVQGQWHGDDCGCTDDRCIGYHHEAHEDCGCFPVQLDRYLEDWLAAGRSTDGPD